MSKLSLCAHCGLTIYTHEKTCPHCNTKEPKMGSRASKAIALSFLMGLGTACQTDIDVASTSSDIKSQLQDASPLPFFTPDPEYDIQPEYGVIDIGVPIAILATQLKIDELILPTEYNKHTPQLQAELQDILRSCSADYFAEDAKMNITITVKDGVIKKPKLRELDLELNQKKCLQNAVSEQKLSVPVSGKLLLSLSIERIHNP